MVPAISTVPVDRMISEVEPVISRVTPAGSVKSVKLYSPAANDAVGDDEDAAQEERKPNKWRDWAEGVHLMTEWVVLLLIFCSTRMHTI